MITKFVDFDTFMDQYGLFLKAAYEKCNIHMAFEDWGEAADILEKEMDEAKHGFEKLERLYLKDEGDAVEIQAEALKTIMELLQVMAVCKKAMWMG